MAAEKPITLLARATVTASGQSLAVELGHDRFFAMLSLDCDAMVGEDLVVKVETATSVVGKWTDLYTALVRSSSVRAVPLVGCDRFIRASWTLGVGVTASLSLLGTSYQTYCNNDDLGNLSLPKVALEGIAPDVLAGACLAATDEAMSYLAGSYDLPITAWGNALRLHTANMGAYHAMKHRGFNPTADELIRLGYTDAIAWLKSGAKTDPSILDTTPTQSSSAGYGISRPERGWAHR